MYRTWVYIDGFNLFYNSLKHTQYRWLDLKKLCESVLAPHNKIERIKYFTARVTDKKGNRCAKDQQTYFEALETIPEIEIILGNFLSHVTQMPLANPSKKNRFVDVIKTDEKGSDVNLASHLLNDAWKNSFDVALVITNDSDLATPINMVIKEHKKLVGILYPTDVLAYSLKDIPPSFKRKIETKNLKTSLFPPKIDAEAAILCPADWDKEDTIKLKALRERQARHRQANHTIKAKENKPDVKIQTPKKTTAKETAISIALTNALNPTKPTPTS